MSRPHRASRQLKDDDAGQRSGVHRLTDCPCCDKKHIRSDNFASHFSTHVKKSEAKDVIDFAHEYDLEHYDDIVTKPDTTKPGVTRYLYGACYECHKTIINSDPLTTDAFSNHVCKEKKEQQKAEMTKEPPNFKLMWDTIAKMKMNEQQTQRMTDTIEDNSDSIDRGEQKWNGMIVTFVKRLLAIKPATAAAAAPVSGGLLALKKHPKLSECFLSDDTDADIVRSIEIMLANQTGLVARHQVEMNKKEDELNVLETQKNVEMSLLNQKMTNVRDNYLSLSEENRRLHNQLAALRSKVASLEQSAQSADSASVPA